MLTYRNDITFIKERAVLKFVSRMNFSVDVLTSIISSSMHIGKIGYQIGLP